MPCETTQAEDVARLTKVEQQAHADRYAIHGALMWSGAWPLGVENLKPTRHVSALLERLTQAESERDAARTEVERLTGRVTSDARDMGRLRQKASDLAQEVATLRERVATLEARYHEERENTDREMNRADTAEARMRELEAWKAHALALRALAGVYNSVVATLSEEAQAPFGRAGVAIVACALLNNEPEATFEETQGGYARYCELLGQHAPSHPAPATGATQGDDVATVRTALDVLFQRSETDSDEQYAKDKGRWVGAVAALDRIAARLPPTPPPGLLEAVVEEYAEEQTRLCAEADAKSERDGDSYCMDACNHEGRATGAREVLTLIRAAYDAAKGGESQPLDKAEVREVLHRHLEQDDAADEMADVETEPEEHARWVWFGRSVVESIAQDLGITLDTPPAGPGGGERVNACGFAPKTAEDVAAFGELVQATARHMETRIAPTPTPSILDALTALGRALRSSSGGIHTLATLEVSGDHYDAVSCGLMGHEYTRVYEDRIHCETGEVPIRIVRRQQAPNEAPAPNHSTPSNSSPAVVWEGRGLKVDGDGEIDASECGLTENGIARTLARALAEAKREVAEAACQAIRRFASRLGDDATGHDTDRCLEELEVALYQHVMEEEEKARHEAAESMRERAARAIAQEAADTHNDAARPLLNECEVIIRALPLE
ncbi:hypothetical protein Mx9_p23 [Myxococcus phage Mx9]|nr:hypothetical protein Mx9_p23 [Myxococcus phage Mx9]